MPLLSVVIPVYGVEDYLALSVASVRRQTLSDIEIICVNDGSPDGSRDVLALLESVDSRVVVIDKPNGGPSSARNVGMKYATGDYVCSLDADDLMDERACETIAAAFDHTDADVVVFGGEAYPSFRGYPWLDRVLSPRAAEYEGFDPKMLFEEETHPFAWRVAFRRSLLGEFGLAYDERLSNGEDEVFLFSLYPRSRRTVLLADKLVKYRIQREGSLMDQYFRSDIGQVGDHFFTVELIFDDWAKGGFVERWPQELFDWSAEFLLLDLAKLPEPHRTEAAARLRDLWANAFGEEGSRRLAALSRFHVLARPIAFAGVPPSGGRLAKIRYYLSRLTLARLAKVLHERLLGRVGPSVDAADRDSWEKEDAGRRREALESLRAEAGEGQGRCL